MRCSIDFAVEVVIPDCLQFFNMMVTRKSVLKEVLRGFLMLDRKKMQMLVPGILVHWYWFSNAIADEECRDVFFDSGMVCS